MISQGNSACLIKFNKSPGDDVKSMSKCLQEMGVKVETASKKPKAEKKVDKKAEIKE